MNRTRLGVIAPCFTTILLLSNCGGSSRVLESLSISPNPAKLQNGKVTLIATGTFSAPPLTVVPMPVNWNQSNCVSVGCAATAVNTPVSVDASGVATCEQGFSGPVLVHARAPKNPSLPPNQLGVPLITGTTTVICP